LKPEEGNSTNGESFREGKEFLFQRIGLGYRGLGFVVSQNKQKIITNKTKLETILGDLNFHPNILRPSGVTFIEIAAQNFIFICR
jgi:hypothetical protein